MVFLQNLLFFGQTVIFPVFCEEIVQDPVNMSCLPVLAKKLTRKTFDQDADAKNLSNFCLTPRLPATPVVRSASSAILFAIQADIILRIRC